MLFFGIALVANQRFFSPGAISGDTSEADKAIIINVRYIQNTDGVSKSCHGLLKSHMSAPQHRETTSIKK